MADAIIFDKDNFGMKIQVNIVDENNAIVDLSDAMVTLTINRDYGSPFSDSALISNPTAGLIDILITEEYTKYTGNYNISILVINPPYSISCKDKIYYLVK
jgi:hypothetical protein